MNIDFSGKIILGIKIIDEQHQKWIDMYNEMDKIMMENHSVISERQIKELLEKMYEYTKYHFSFEEDFLNKIGYPDFVKHKREHKTIDLSIYENYRKAIKNDYVSGREIWNLLKKWILNHILVQDKAFADFIFENNIDYKQILEE
jgi:hemerythrin-like metal-binding protein